jgi:hypothetical protein
MWLVELLDRTGIPIEREYCDMKEDAIRMAHETLESYESEDARVRMYQLRHEYKLEMQLTITEIKVD